MLLMQTWIFQANPDRFDIDRFLDVGPDETLWLVRRQDAERGEDVRSYGYEPCGSMVRELETEK